MTEFQEKLLSLRDQLEGSTYKVSDIRDGNYPYSFRKFYAIDCSVWELRKLPLIMGTWIDIFPIDEWDESEEVAPICNN